MIYNNSSDTVLIKKISLKIWTLRDEIEARIQTKLEAGTAFEDMDLIKIRGDYTPKNNQTNNVLSLKANSELDTDEDEMLRAMSEESKAEESKAEGEEIPPKEPKESENIESINSPTNVANIDQNIISISLDAPHISEEKVSKGKTVLAEINMDKMFFFCNKAFTEGQSIVIQFCIPKSFIINADILYCRPFNLKSRIISQNNYSHRALIRFNFLKEGERALLRQFLQSIEPDNNKASKKANTSKNDTNTSDFSELDDLGL